MSNVTTVVARVHKGNVSDIKEIVHSQRYIALLEQKCRQMNDLYQTTKAEYENQMDSFMSRQRGYESEIEALKEELNSWIRLYDEKYESHMVKIDEEYEARFQDITDTWRKTNSKQIDDLMLENHTLKNTITKIKRLAQIPRDVTVCVLCGKDNPKLMCSCCRWVAYCDTECQRKHWKSHNYVCINMGLS